MRLLETPALVVAAFSLRNHGTDHLCDCELRALVKEVTATFGVLQQCREVQTVEVHIGDVQNVGGGPRSGLDGEGRWCDN